MTSSNQILIKIYLSFMLIYMHLVNSITIDYMIDGNFTQNTCTVNGNQWCLWGASSYQKTYVPGWTTTTEFQIQYAARWSNAQTTLSSTNFICDLVGGVGPLCLIQTIVNVPTGDFNLTYAYLCFRNINYEDGRIAVYFNGNKVDYVTPTDLNLNQRSVTITISAPFTVVQLKFCGQHTNKNQLSGSGLYEASFTLTYTEDNYYNFTSGQWIQCSITYTNCLYCSISACKTCADGYYLNTSILCKTCKSKFMLCTSCSNTQCLSCDNTSNLAFGRCCPLDKYINPSVLLCYTCISKFPNCYGCTMARCNSCLSGYLYNSTAHTCAICTSKFSNCTTCNQTQCLSCAVDTTLQSGICCPSSQYYNLTTNQCSTCLTGTFFNIMPLLCELCSSQYANCDTCDNLSCFTCQIGYFYDQLNTSCLLCSSQYTRCSTCNSSQCIMCDLGILIFGKCCLTNQYYNSYQSSCSSCTSAFSNCNTCNQTMCFTQLNNSLTGQGQKCLSSQFFNHITDVCQNCPVNCEKCNQDKCLACQDGLFMLMNICYIVSDDQDIKQLAQSLQSGANKTISNPLTVNAIKNPVLKSILNVLCQFFAPLDDLWIFSYHSTNYTFTVASLLNSIRQTQSDKFSLSAKIGLIENFTRNIVNSFYNYTYYGKPKFISVENKGSGFYPNVVQFVLTTIPQNLIMFLVLRLLFRILFNFKCSLMIRQYTFDCYFVFALLDGNMQFFTYVSSNQLQTLFHFSVNTKMQNMIFVCALFILLQASITTILLLNYFCKKKAIYFLQNRKNSMIGIFSLLITFALRNMVIATVSSFCSNDYLQMIWLLNTTQALLFLALVTFSIKYQCFRVKSKMSFLLIFCLLRISLQMSFALLDNTNIAEKIQSNLLLIYLCFWLSTIIFHIIKLMANVSSYFIRMILQIKFLKKADKTNLKQNIFFQTKRKRNGQKIQKCSYIKKEVIKIKIKKERAKGQKYIQMKRDMIFSIKKEIKNTNLKNHVEQHANINSLQLKIINLASQSLQQKNGRKRMFVNKKLSRFSPKHSLLFNAKKSIFS